MTATAPAYRYVKPTQCPDNMYVGGIYQAREWKRKAWKGVRELRRRLREAGYGPYSGAGAIRLQLLKAEIAHREAMEFERRVLATVEARANELGYTTIKN